MLNKIKDFVKPDKNNPDEIRKKNIMDILLRGFFVLSLFGLITIVVFLFINPDKWQKYDNQLIVMSAIVGLLSSTGIYYLNKLSSELASFLFLLLLTIIISFSDTPEQLSNGRSLFLFMITIAISSLILFPASSFIFAIFNSIIIIYLSVLSEATPNITAIFVFFFLALISWLSARSLEQALKDLRGINLNLDKLVEQKTQELATTLSRELVLAGRNQAILNSIADGVIVFDEHNTAILVNPALSQLTEIPLHELINKDITNFIQNKAISPAAQGLLLGLVENPRKSATGMRLMWNHKTLSTSIARVYDAANRSIGTVAVFRDVTREVELEKMKDSFMAIVSHELRTPLNAILGYAEMLKEGVYGSINEKQQGIAVRMMTNTQRLLAIVTDLLDQAQIQSGKMKIQMHPCNPTEMLEALHGVMDKIAEDKGLQFFTELDPAMPRIIMGDAQRLHQIMVNLANNSIKFTEKGSVRVKITRINEDSWQIQNIDTGDGIPKEAQEYIFESFRQVEGSSTRKHGGVGLGLSIVKQLVDYMKGNVVVESEVGKGSTFTVNLPLIQPPTSN